MILIDSTVDMTMSTPLWWSSGGESWDGRVLEAGWRFFLLLESWKLERRNLLLTCRFFFCFCRFLLSINFSDGEVECELKQYVRTDDFGVVFFHR